MFGVTNLASGLTAAAVDSRPRKQIIIKGDTHIDYNENHYTDQYGSIFYDGDGDGLEIIGGDDFNLDGEYTIEMWFRLTDTDRPQMIITNRAGSGYAPGDFYIQFNADVNKIQWGINGNPTKFSDQRINKEEWIHLAIVRNSTNLQLYLHGSPHGDLIATGPENDINSDSSNGKIFTGLLGSGLDLKGHMAEIRISTVARYFDSVDEIEPIFTNDKDTVLLIHGAGSLGEDIILDDNR